MVVSLFKPPTKIYQGILDQELTSGADSRSVRLANPILIVLVRVGALLPMNTGLMTPVLTAAPVMSALNVSVWHLATGIGKLAVIASSNDQVIRNTKGKKFTYNCRAGEIVLCHLAYLVVRFRQIW